MNSKTKTFANVKTLTTVAMLCALSYVVMVVARIPVVLFLKYEPKDIIITIGGFIYGPFTAFVMSVIVSILEMITVSDTGLWGCLMNIIATCSFACTASYIYKKKHTLNGAIISLVLGSLVMTTAMLLWNYIITPFYMNLPREDIVKLLIPAILPFNAIKSGLNMAGVILLYKPMALVMRHAGIISQSSTSQTGHKIHIGVYLFAAAILITCILFILVLTGKL